MVALTQLRIILDSGFAFMNYCCILAGFLIHFSSFSVTCMSHCLACSDDCQESLLGSKCP